MRARRQGASCSGVHGGMPDATSQQQGTSVSSSLQKLVLHASSVMLTSRTAIPIKQTCRCTSCCVAGWPLPLFDWAPMASDVHLMYDSKTILHGVFEWFIGPARLLHANLFRSHSLTYGPACRLCATGSLASWPLHQVSQLWFDCG